MSEITCPRCGHHFVPSSGEEDRASRPDPSVVGWLRGGAVWSCELATDEAYGDYLSSCGDAPVSRRRFVADLAFLGVPEVLDDGTPMLVRD